jgi:hypothetical protein
VGNALNVFRERGMLKKGMSVGRNKDKSVEDQLKAFGAKDGQENDRVKIEHFDKQGRKLTMKEAFR